jgi:PAS domain S-box-containing protein
MKKQTETKELRKRAEEELRESEQRYRVVIENANQGILVVQDQVVKFCNDRLIEISGYSREELASRQFADFIHPDDRQMVIEYHMKRYKGEEVPDLYQSRFIDKVSKQVHRQTQEYQMDGS